MLITIAILLSMATSNPVPQGEQQERIAQTACVFKDQMQVYNIKKKK